MHVTVFFALSGGVCVCVCVVGGGNTQINLLSYKVTFEPQHVISHNVTFWHVYTQTSLCIPLLSLETPNNVQSVDLLSKNIQATSKGSDQTAHMRRLVWAFAGRTYHIVGNLMSWLI